MLPLNLSPLHRIRDQMLLGDSYVNRVWVPTQWSRNTSSTLEAIPNSHPGNDTDCTLNMHHASNKKQMHVYISDLGTCLSLGDHLRNHMAHLNYMYFCEITVLENQVWPKNSNQYLYRQCQQSKRLRRCHTIEAKVLSWDKTGAGQQSWIVFVNCREKFDRGGNAPIPLRCPAGGGSHVWRKTTGWSKQFLLSPANYCSAD